MNKTNRILGELYYFIGKQQTNFRIFTNYIKSDGSKGFTKWVYYLNATEEELDKATHRTLLKNEIVLDFDPFNNETFEQLKERVNTVCISLKNEGISYNCYSTGSRGFHIHIFSNLLLLLSKEERIEFRNKFINYYKAESQKNTENVPIALECVPHWKSGKNKTRCYF